MTISRRRALLSAVSTICAAWSVQPAAALTVFCTNCSQEVTEVLEYANMLDQLANEISQLNTMIDQYTNMVTNTLTLPNMVWSKIKGLYDKVMSVYNSGVAIANKLSNLDETIAEKFEGYGSYSTSTFTVSSWKDKFNQWSDDTKEVVKTSLQVVKDQLDDIDSEESDLSQMESAAQGASGRLQALQAIATLTGATTRQIQKLRILVGTQAQQMAQFMATQQDKEDANNAAWQQYNAHKTIETSGGKRF